MKLEFLGRDAIVTHAASAGATCLWITFDHMRPRPAHDAYALGDRIIERLGYAQAHVFSTANNWFQTPEMEEAIIALNRIRAAYDRCVVWGSSMGGFAALQFAERFDADAVLACGAQISINPDKVPWDVRFAAEAKAIPEFLYDSVATVALPAQTYLSYDYSLRLDRLNAREIQRHHPTVSSIVMPFSDHVPTMFMVGHNVIEQVFHGISKGDLDIDAVQSRRRMNRVQYKYYTDAVGKYLEVRSGRANRERLPG